MTLNIGNEPINNEEIATKIEADIAFLIHHLALIRRQKQPNAVIIEIYQGMLESRRAVLAWLLQGNKKISNS